MAQTSVSLYPKYMMGEALGGLGPGSVTYVTVGLSEVSTVGVVEVEAIDVITVEYVKALPIEVTETVDVDVSVCD